MTTKTANVKHCAARLEAVRVTFDSYLSFALANVNLEVRRGEVLGLIGPKSSGKSTTLRLLAGKLRPNEGKVTVYGRSPRRASVKKRIGYLPQLNNLPKATSLRRLLIRWFPVMQPPLSRLPADLGLARLLLRNPDFLLLDEPFAGLDAAGFSELKKRVVELRSQGKTVVLTNVTVLQAKDVCDRMAIYFRGQIEALGTLTELLASPDAIRVLGPVLPDEIAQRTLQAIRAGLPDSKPFEPQTAQSHEPGAKSSDPNRNPSETVDHERLNRLTRK